MTPQNNLAVRTDVIRQPHGLSNTMAAALAPILERSRACDLSPTIVSHFASLHGAHA
jgi:hypothetical protein